jgi:2-hydroxy-6-oxonona-2,4-dienedioate hydrolase
MRCEPQEPLARQWDDVEGTTIHARVSASWGSPAAPPIVLIHGLVISSLYMVPTARRLAPTFRVLAPDLPGFGASDKPRRVLSIAELADALGRWFRVLRLGRSVLVGNSLGCQIIVEFATRYPEYIQAAVLAGPTMDPRARTAPEQIGRWVRDWRLEPLSLGAAHAKDYYRSGLRRGWRTFRFALTDPVEEKLAHLTAPTLVVRGSRDVIVPQRWAEEVATGLPNGELVVIPGGPHVVNYTTPLEFTRVIRDFLYRLGIRGEVRREKRRET